MVSVDVGPHVFLTAQEVLEFSVLLTTQRRSSQDEVGAEQRDSKDRVALTPSGIIMLALAWVADFFFF